MVVLQIVEGVKRVITHFKDDKNNVPPPYTVPPSHQGWTVSKTHLEDFFGYDRDWITDAEKAAILLEDYSIRRRIPEIAAAYKELHPDSDLEEDENSDDDVPEENRSGKKGWGVRSLLNALQAAERDQKVARRRMGEDL